MCAVVDKQVDELLEYGIIEPSTSAYNSPLVVVKKKTSVGCPQEYRVVNDFRGLNAQTVEYKFPLPLLVDVIDGANGTWC